MTRLLQKPLSGWVEPVLIFLFFLVHAGGLAPSVNEAHYLAKARHHWDPSWCPNDQFMNSADTHLAFYWTFGWVTKYASMATSAWLGRFAVWAALAVAWTHLSRAICAVPGCALLSAALATTLAEITNLAGEWCVGGVEGKVIAWSLVFLALRHVIRDEWVPVWPLLGVAIAFHALVGGWAWAICTGLLLMGRTFPSDGVASDKTLRSMIPSIGVGLAAASIGIVPALAMDWNVEPEVVTEAHLIQVNERLSHHLRLSGMKWYRHLRFATLVAVWLAISAGASLSPELTRLRRFVNGSLLISLAGGAIELFGLLNPEAAASLLRFYWFRMSDVLVPTGLTLLVVARVVRMPNVTQRAKQRALSLALIWLMIWVPTRFVYLRQDRRPQAVRQARPYRARRAEQIAARYADWCDVCDWIREYTATDATFLSPTSRQTFKWFADRGEFATWKGMPQNAEAVLAWKRRRLELEAISLFVPDQVADAEAVLALAQRYGLTHLLMEEGQGGLVGYLPLIFENEHFKVYRLPRK